MSLSARLRELVGAGVVSVFAVWVYAHCVSPFWRLGQRILDRKLGKMAFVLLLSGMCGEWIMGVENGAPTELFEPFLEESRPTQCQIHLVSSSVGCTLSPFLPGKAGVAQW